MDGKNRQQINVIAMKSNSKNGGRILLAEDHAITQEIIRAILEAEGCEVEIVADGADAVKAVETGSYDLVLMDVQLLGTNGLTAFKQIRALDGCGSNIPVIAITALTSQHDAKILLEAGMSAHLPKPFRRAELVAAVKSILHLEIVS